MPDVIFLFTDGEPRARTRTLMKEQKDLADKCSEELKEEKDVKIVGLAVGRWQEYISYIEKWSSKNSVFTADVEEMNKILKELVTDTCNPPDHGKCMLKNKFG